MRGLSNEERAALTDWSDEVPTSVGQDLAARGLIRVVRVAVEGGDEVSDYYVTPEGERALRFDAVLRGIVG